MSGDPMAVRRPIGLKIFGIAAVLLVLMICVTLLSSLQVRRLGHQLDVLADTYIQLDQLLGEVRANGLGEIILMERILQNPPQMPFKAAREEAAARHKEAADCNPEATRAAVAKIRQAHATPGNQNLVIYEFIKLCADDRLVHADALITNTRALEAVKHDADHIAVLADLQDKVNDVPGARDRLHDAFEDYLEELARKGAHDQRLLGAIRGQIEENRTAVARRISDVSRVIHRATRGSADEARAMETRVQWLSWGITLGACALGLLFAALVTRGLVRPVYQLLVGTRAVERGDLNVQIRLQSADEIAQLGDSFNRMVQGLRQKEEIQDIFGKYVDPRVVKGLLERRDFGQAGERRVMTVFFSDLEGFTAVAERLTPGGVVKLLNQYFSLMAEAIRAQSGVIDKYIGDSVMAFWGPPFAPENEHAALACFAALEQQARIAQFQALLPEVMGLRKGVPTVRVRMGLATGEVTVGSIGSADARSYTVIGDTVNLASRLESVNKQYHTGIIISEETRVLAGEAIETRELDAVRVVGKTDAVGIYELLARKGAASSRQSEIRTQYEAALMLYRKQQWDEAQAGFQRCLQIAPDDGPAKLFLERIGHLRTAPPGKDWDGAWTLSEK